MSNFAENVGNFLKKQSQISLKEILESEAVALNEIKRPPDLAGKTWVAFILISFRKVSIQFKCYYNAENLKPVTAKALHKELEAVNDEHIRGHVKEFCNLTAGKLKSCLQDILKLSASETSFTTAEASEINKDSSGKDNGAATSEAWTLTEGNGVQLICECVCKVPEGVKIDLDMEMSTLVMDYQGQIEFY